MDGGAVHRPQVAGLLELAAGAFAVLDSDFDSEVDDDPDPEVDSGFEDDPAVESDLAAAGLSVAVALDRLSVL